MPRRYTIEASWSVLESVRHQIIADSADQALEELLRAAQDDPDFYRATETWSDTVSDNSYEVRAENARLLRYLPSSEERRRQLFPELVDALRTLLSRADKAEQRRIRKLLARAEAALA